jgi:cardiolipin synthase
MTLFYILLGIYLVLALIIVLSLLVNGVRPTKMLAWLLGVFTIPVGGILLYLVLGRNRRKKQLDKLAMPIPLYRQQQPENRASAFPVKYGKLARLITVNCHFMPLQGNDIRYLKDGRSTFKSIFGALESAQHYIHIEYYIFEDGALARKMLRLFSRKIRHGVAVRLIYDGVGSFSLSRKYLRQLRQLGVEVYPFLPFRFGRFLTTVNYRNHRKIVVVDGKVGFTGGMNLSDKYMVGDVVLGQWHDMHLRVAGAVVAQLNQVFLRDWHLVCQQRPELPPYPHFRSTGKSTVQVVHNGPDDSFPAIEQTYFSIITTAQNYLYITNPYIIPGQSVLTALETAALGGVDVRLLLSEKQDSRLVNWSVRSYFTTLLRAGVRIFLFSDGFLHSKVMLSDDQIASIGTANIDVRSFEHNYEVNTVIYDAQFVTALRQDFLQDCLKSRELTYTEHEKRPWGHRVKEGFAKVFSPLL